MPPTTHHWHPRDLWGYDDDDRECVEFDPITDKCLAYAPAHTPYLRYILAGLLLFILLLIVLTVLLLSRRRHKTGHTPYYGTRWMFRSPPGVPPRPNQMNAWGERPGVGVQMGGYPTPRGGGYYFPTTYGQRTGTTRFGHGGRGSEGWSEVPVRPEGAHTAGYGLGDRLEMELPPPPKYEAGSWRGAQGGEGEGERSSK